MIEKIILAGMIVYVTIKFGGVIVGIIILAAALRVARGRM